MTFLEYLNLFGAPAKEIPCITGKGAPTTATEGAVGCFYMDTDTGEIYKCTAATNGNYTWEVNIDFSVFGYRYSAAVDSYDISANDGKSSVKMYLFPYDGGYTAIVSGHGAMKNHSLTLHPEKGFKVMTEERDYAAKYLKKIKKVCIERDVTEIGDYFMYNAYHLKEVVFEDTSKIARLGKYCFGCTQISGEYTFNKLQNGTTLDRSFFCCPKLEGITLSTDVTENISITLSELAFFGCLGLKYFKVEDPVNTNLVFGRACFEYCTGLELIEFQPEKTTAEGFNFLMVPVTSVRVKRRMDVDKGTLAHTRLDNMQDNAWGAITGVLNTMGSWFANANKMYSYINCVNTAADYAGEHHELDIYEFDEQKKDEYLEYADTTDLNCKGVFWGKRASGAFRVPYYGSCWLFAYMHIWNVLHPNAQYDTIEHFIAKVEETKILVDSTELGPAIATWTFKNDVMATSVYTDGYFDVGKEILATDLPTALKLVNSDGSVYTTVGAPGEASWGVRKALTWTGERLSVETLTKDNRTAWADIKRSTIDSILAGKPVVFECVGYGGEDTTSSNYGGLHAVAGIGYDASTDTFKIVDSTWGLPSDEVPMVYWTSFEALLEPSGESAVWVFSAFDSGATLTPA